MVRAKPLKYVTSTTPFLPITVVFGFLSYVGAQTSTTPDFQIPLISGNRTITVVNNCKFPVYPGFLTTNGTGPYTTGFYLDSKQRRSVWVGWDWSGRLWARTNCSFYLANATTAAKIKAVTDNFTIPDGQKLAGGCLTGDCGSAVECQLSGLAPTTLAEFTITGWQNQTYYDISLVDGYDLDMKITPSYDSPEKPRVNNTPICIASTDLSSPLSGRDLNENSLNQSFTFGTIHRWCPREMLLFASQRGRQSVFPYPDDDDPTIGGGWTPCLSACAYSNNDWDCCKGRHDKSNTCGPNLYSQRAKQVCGDAYSYAYDDYLSTFAVPSAPGDEFEVMFCPGGVSTNILKSTLGSTANVGAESSWLLITISAIVGMAVLW
ncbi:Osmotin [Drechslerella dactyloides]|uniref:Osmotin n=1 Tax=Drechslerella dactyloides TaxID=74499 RepID=A0AAD6J404_DREDA|nr:Osmotin [Drechslerella dactyloides]